MKQTVNLAIKFRDTSFTLNIKNVYQINNQLIVISDIRSQGFAGEAITRRSASITVDTNSNGTLPVKHYALVSDNIKSFKSFTSELGLKITVVDALASVPELKDNLDIEPLTNVPTLAAQSMLNNATTLPEYDSDEDDNMYRVSLKRS